MSIEVELNSNLICEICSGTGNIFKMKDGKKEFNSCICFGGCLY